MMTGLFGNILLASYWGSCFIILLLLINRLFPRKLSASWRYYIWIVVLLRLLIPAFATVYVEPSRLPFAQPPMDIANMVYNQEDIAGNNNTYPAMINENNSSIDYEDVGTIEASNAYKPGGQHIWSYMQMIWMGIAVLMIAVKVLNYYSFQRRVQKSSVRPSRFELDIFYEKIIRFDLSDNIKLIKSHLVSTPLVMGMIHPVVVIPAGNFEPDQLACIYEHELTHIKQHDLMIKWLFVLAKSIHWFNPLVYIASNRMDFYCEVVCDTKVLKDRNLSERKEYGITIIEVAKRAIKQNPSVNVCMNNNKFTLKKRMQFILNQNYLKKNRAISLGMTFVVMGFGAYSGIQYSELEAVSMIPPSIQNVMAAGIKNESPIAAEKTNILMVGLDEYETADVLMVASYDSKSNQMSLLSIPRDTYLKPTADSVQKLEKLGISLPSELKISQLTAYTKEVDGIGCLQKEVEEMLGISIDYHIKMNLSAFKEIVDTMGGVSMTIPQGGFYYTDPYQNLNIAIPEGVQVLDGERSEMVVRYRATYKRGDLDRITVQQQFLMEAARQLFEKDNVLQLIPAMFSVVTEHTDTNLSLLDLPKLLTIAAQIKIKDLTMYTLPGEPETINYRSYYMPKEEEIKMVMANVF